MFPKFRERIKRAQEETKVASPEEATAHFEEKMGREELARIDAQGLTAKADQSYARRQAEEEFEEMTRKKAA